MPGLKPLIAISGEIWGVLKRSWDEKVFREVVFCFSHEYRKISIFSQPIWPPWVYTGVTWPLLTDIIVSYWGICFPSWNENPLGRDSILLVL